MRWARSYSIIDHQILHGRYLHRLSHEAMALYLFLVVVGDRQGRSFYADRSITEILRLSGPRLHQAREELIQEGLISYRRPYWEVKNLPQRRDPNPRQEQKCSSRSSTKRLAAKSKARKAPLGLKINPKRKIFSQCLLVE